MRGPEVAIAYIYIHFLCGIMAFGEMACLPGPLAVVFPLWDFAGLFIYLFGFLSSVALGCNSRRGGL